MNNGVRTVFRAAIQQAGLVMCLTMVAGSSHALSADEPRDTRQPSADRADMLTRFVAECVRIAPGSEQFPELAEAHRPFRISKYETTQELYEAVTGTNPSRWKGPRNSVETITWLQANAFCDRLTELLRTKQLIAADEVVRLPTAAEWEYCCRAGTNTTYSFGEAVSGDGGTSLIDQYAWHTGNAAGNDPAVGVLKPNAWGLHDTHGYLWEFVADSSAEAEDLPSAGDNATPKQKNGASAPVQTICGGSWRDQHRSLASGSKRSVLQTTASDAIGFRCVIAPPAPIARQR